MVFFHRFLTGEVFEPRFNNLSLSVGMLTDGAAGIQQQQQNNENGGVEEIYFSLEEKVKLCAIRYIFYIYKYIHTGTANFGTLKLSLRAPTAITPYPVRKMPWDLQLLYVMN
jgi:hypothetical protein